MALHPDFPKDPHEILLPSLRWFPADESRRSATMEKLLPPLVPKLRREVKEFRDSGYVGATETSKSLLKWWFIEPHLLEKADGTSYEFQYYFSQREALETIIYLYDVVGAKDKFDLMRFDLSGEVNASHFDESWRRYVIKMATGAGKTKVMSLALAWSFFHKLYELDSQMARNFLVITPNIIVLDRIYKDFEGLRIFFQDPVLPPNGYNGRSWRNDFQLTLHRQDEVRIIQPTGNIFLTNIHRVYAGNESLPSLEDDDLRDYFLGPKPVSKTTDSKYDLGMIVRDVDELMVINDEAHHVHDSHLAWFKSIEDIHNRLLQKDSALSMQLDVTATPKHNNGAIFAQTVSDYPLVEAIAQNVVKHPVLPDGPSRAKLKERESAKFTEKYADYLELGVLEWRKAYLEHEKLGKKSILFVMTDDTRNCDEVAEYLEERYPDLKDGVLVIHTKKNGEISEASSGKDKEELERLRALSNKIDSAESPYKAIISVLMLKEGWDVRNVTTIVGLRAYSAKSNILPEQTLGRGLRKMYPGQTPEYVSVIGTDAFMEFVETIQAEGVELERKPMGHGTEAKTPLVVEVDKENTNKDIEALDIELPVLSARIYREYKNLGRLDPAKFGFQPVIYKQFKPEEQREIVFKEITTDEISHKTVLDMADPADWHNVIGWFCRSIMRSLRLFSGYDALYGKVKLFIRDYLFGQEVELEDQNTMRNLSELEAKNTILETFKKEINAQTVCEKGDAEIRDYIKLRKTRPFMAQNQEYLPAKKSVFNRIIGDSHFELEFASFLENCADVLAYAKNYMAVNFKLDYVNADGDISNYYPDFIVKLPKNQVIIVETKGNPDLDTPKKIERLKQWCQDASAAQTDVKYNFAYIEQADFEKYRPKNFGELMRLATKYK